MPSLELNSESLYSSKSILLGPFISVGLMLFLLGIYVLLFVLVLYFLFGRATNAIKRKLHLAWVTPLFLLSVSSTVMKGVSIIKQGTVTLSVVSISPKGQMSAWEYTSVLDLLAGVFYVLANCIADAILLYRCFVIWGPMTRNRIFVFPLMALVFLTNAIGLIGFILGSITTVARLGGDITTGYFIANAVNTFLLTPTVAGRIWWLSREPRRIMGTQIERKYDRIIGMVVESGLLYSASLIIYVVIRQNHGPELFPLVGLMVGIAPTLIILGSSLGLFKSAVPGSRIMISTLRFAEPLAGGDSSEALNANLRGDIDSNIGEAHKAECRSATVRGR
ncbi:hypothetical protein Moror_7776 [Moniliophthora roreri MCA 2997]|uniref:Uncharacterized protein n=1 Tax=Moniliophthora roreri (strain MCA 2997) TaxID=1381753 RepID=V2YEQ5_MONRO|nr:hypothetical protein Moror_7776 [Moniliophthora roreri MCA 2997]